MEEKRGLISATKTCGFAGALGLILACALTLPVHAIDWRWRYRTLRSPHFELVYNEDQRALARRFIVAAERAHELVFPIFGEGPAKTILILQDDTDQNNGEANFLPYPHIRIYPVLSTTNGALGDYGDWALEIMVHEYTHILNMYPAHGVYRPFKYVFGTILRPNAVLPRWYLEGLAVDLESALTSHGRLRAVETRASARALTLGHRFTGEDVARINEQQMLTWPYGGRPYLFGGWWWETTVQHGPGLGVVKDLNQDYSRRIPFLIDGPMRNRLGHDAAGTLDQTAERLELRAESELKQIRGAPVPKTRAIVAQNGEQAVFAISPSGRHLVYFLGEPGLPTSVLLRSRDAGDEPFDGIAPRVLLRSHGSVQVRWLDDDRFVFDQIDVKNPYVFYRDLYLYDLNTKQTKRLTRGERAQEAAASPSAKQIVYVRNAGGQNSIHVMDLDSGQSLRVIGGNLYQRLSGPEFTSENEISFSLRQRDGRETLKTFNLTTRALGDWQPTLTTAENLRRSGEGWLVSDAGTGVRNVYWLGPGGRAPLAVTNTLTDADHADFDPRRKELIYSELGSTGRRLVATPFAPQRVVRVQTEGLPPPPPVPNPKFTTEEGGYHPLAYMWPRYWIPMAYQVENGVMLQGQTGSSDPVGRNDYDLSGSFDTVTKKPSYGFNYANSSLPIRIATGYAKAQTYLGASGATLQAQRGYLNFAQYWPFGGFQGTWSAGGVWLDTTSPLASYRRMGPQASVTMSNLNSPFGAWHGLQLKLDHSEYLARPGYYAYGRSSIHLAQTARLGRGHHVSLDVRGVFSPRMDFGRVIVLGERSLGGNYLVNLVNSDLMMRGYPSANFIGRKVINANLEYALPLIPIDRGFGTKPLFVRSLEIAFFTDVIGVDGAAYNVALNGYQRSPLGHYYAGTGAEFRLATTAAYHVPFSLTLGLYYGTDRMHGGGFSPFIGMGLGGLEGLKTKTP